MVTHLKYIIKAVLTWDVSAEIPAMLNCGERMENVRARELVKCRYLYHMALLWIPFRVKHTTKSFCFWFKYKYKFSMETIFFTMK